MLIFGKGTDRTNTAPPEAARGNRQRAAPARGDRPVRARGRAAALHHTRKKRDECGLVFGFDLDGEPIGTIRIVPMGYGLTLTDTLLEQLGPQAPA